MRPRPPAAPERPNPPLPRKTVRTGGSAPRRAAAGGLTAERLRDAGARRLADVGVVLVSARPTAISSSIESR